MRKLNELSSAEANVIRRKALDRIFNQIVTFSHMDWSTQALHDKASNLASLVRQANLSGNYLLFRILLDPELRNDLVVQRDRLISNHFYATEEEIANIITLSDDPDINV